MFLSLLLAFSTFTFAKTDAKNVTPATQEQLSLLKSVDEKYAAAETVVMSTKKITTSGVFTDDSQEATGTLSLKKGKLRLDLENKNKDKTLIVADGTFMWLVTPPPKDFKDAKTQVIKSPLSSKQVQTQGLLRILNEGGILKQFSASGVQKDNDLLTFFLQPKAQSEELKRVLIKINPEDKTIAGLKYWDTLDNETTYDFSKIQFNKKLDKTLFTYKPPKNADVVTP